MSAEIKTITLIVNNMTCVNCENIIERELSHRNGILDVKASYSSGKVKITYNELYISPQEMCEELKKHDYQAQLHSDTKIASEDTKLGIEKQTGAMDKSKSQERRTSTGKVDITSVLAIVIILLALYMIANHLGLFNIFRNFPVAKAGMGYGMLFIIGLLTSVHCVAMCGGICLSQCAPVQAVKGEKQSKLMTMRPSLLYNLGRVLSYTVIGGIVGAIGSVISFSTMTKGMVQIFAGVFMVIMGLNMLHLFPWLRRLNPRMPKIFAKKIYSGKNSNSPFYIGLLNGLMPCGPLQAMQLYALSTGSPVKGAISMFLFSIGTVPLLFLFGALGSLLNKKFTGKMMTVSAVLVVTLGVFMFSNGMGLSGIALPSLPSVGGKAEASSTNIAKIENGVQVVTTGLSSGRYEPIIVQKGIPVKWIIQAEAGDINGCNNSIIVPKYNLQKNLEAGDNVIEFTPTESGKIPFSCWMGMIRSQITVVDDVNQIDNQTLEDSNKAASGTSGGSCCAGGGGLTGNPYGSAKNYGSQVGASCCQ